MNKLVVLGKSTYEKTTLMLYIAKGIQSITDEDVVLITSNSFYKYDFNPHEFVSGIDIIFYKDPESFSSAIKSELYQNMLIDVGDMQVSPINDALLIDSKISVVSNQAIEVITNNEAILTAVGHDQLNMSLVLYPLNEHSKISEKYLQKKYLATHNYEEVFSYNYDEQDMAKLIDNGHNGEPSIHRMSKGFKLFIYDIIEAYLGLESDNKSKKKQFKLLERGKQR